MSDVIGFWSAHRAELVTLIGEHVMLVGIATAAAIALGVPLGIFAARRPRLASPLVATAAVFSTTIGVVVFTAAEVLLGVVVVPHFTVVVGEVIVRGNLDIVISIAVSVLGFVVIIISDIFC